MALRAVQGSAGRVRTGVRGGASGLTYFGNFALGSMPSYVTDSSPSPGGVVTDSTGKLTFKGNNLLLNSATLSTQSVTLPASATNYVLSIKGTGSVTLSGAGTGTLTGTGAGNRVTLPFTGTAGASLTLTVSGSVTSARLSAVTYETSFRAVDDFDTGASAYYGPAFDYASGALALRYFPASRTNLFTGFGSGSWVAFGSIAVTAGYAVSPDGTTNAVRLQGTGSYYQGLTLVAGQVYTASVWVQGTSANQSVQFDYYDGSTDVLQAIPATTSSKRYTFTFTATSTGGNLSVSLSPNAGGADVLVFGPQLELASFAGPYIPAGASAVTMAADVLGTTSPLTGYLAAKPSALTYRSYQTGVETTANYAGGAFAWPAAPAWLETLTVP